MVIIALTSKGAATDACIIFNIKRKQMSPHAVEKLVRQTAEADGCETEIIIEQEPGSLGNALVEHYVCNVLPHFRVRMVPTTKGKMVRGHTLARPLSLGRHRQK